MRNAGILLAGAAVWVLGLPLPLATCEGAAAEPWIELGVGSTPLADLGAYRIAYRLYGGPRVEMPLGWSGNFTEDVGIAYFEHGVQNGRRAFVLHCPWKNDTGSVCLEYSLALPKEPPLALSFSIAMRADITTKSDGVTFSAFVLSDGQRAELMREHYTKAEWKDFRFDLSRYAGQRIILGFQTEPGPKKDASFDFSLLGEPTILVGRHEDTRPTLLRQMVNSPAYKASARVDLAALANASGRGIVPTPATKRRTRVEYRYQEVHLPRGGDNPLVPVHYYGFVSEGDDGAVEYHCRIEPAWPLRDTLSALGASEPPGIGLEPCHGGGIQFAPDKTKPYGFRSPDRAELLAHKLDGDLLTVVWRYGLGPLEADVAWTYQLVGRALRITANSESRHIARFSLGQPLNPGLRRGIRIPYLASAQAYFLQPQELYVMSYLDWHESMASLCPGNEAIYLPRLDGTRNKLYEVGYLAVSPNLDEVLPNLPHEPSPYLKLLGPKMMLDIWGGSFDSGAKLLRTLKSYGVDHAAVIWHDWQRYGYDVKLPDHLPASPGLGGDEAMKRLADAAREVGYLFSLHENYIDFYPDAPSYDPKDVVLNPKGEFSKAWYHPGTKVQSFALKPTRMLHYASQNSPEIHRRFGTTAAYLDVHTCVPPWHHVDFAANVMQPSRLQVADAGRRPAPQAELGAAFRTNERAYHGLFQFERDTHQGPLFGEGAGHFYWAGIVDGVEAQVDGGQDCPLLLDFDLLKIHPQMVNHGMGYYTRWLRTGDQTQWGVETPTPAQMDQYRATEIAYGHAGFVGSPLVTNPYFVWREHNLVTPVQALYGTAKATSILYEVDGQLVTASAAVPCGTLDRARVAYDSGLVVHVNLRKDDWAVEGHVLPQYGFLALGWRPNLLAYTAKRGDTIVDFAENAETLFADARTHGYRPWLDCRAIEPRLKSLKDLGDGSFEITYEWLVEDALDRDYIAFVHFGVPGSQNGEGILFQNDHAPNPPTSKWQKGTVVTDGPHRVRVPADRLVGTSSPSLRDGKNSGPAGRTTTGPNSAPEGRTTICDIGIGLYQPQSGRVPLRGVGSGQHRYLIGRLNIEREGGGVKKMEVQSIDDERARQLAQRRVFEERMNTAGRPIDFGPVRTDGSFKIYKRGQALTLLPYPRDKAFAIELDLARLAPGANAATARIEAFDAAGRSLGPVPSTSRGSWLIFRAGLPGAARFDIR